MQSIISGCIILTATSLFESFNTALCTYAIEAELIGCSLNSLNISFKGFPKSSWITF